MGLEPASSSSASASRVLQAKVVDDATDVTTGDAQLVLIVDASLDGLTLESVAAYVSTVSSANKPTVQIRNVTDAADMLSTALTIDASAFTSYTATVPAVIDAGAAVVAEGDRIAIDVDGAGTGAKGLGVVLAFA